MRDFWDSLSLPGKLLLPALLIAFGFMSMFSGRGAPSQCQAVVGAWQDSNREMADLHTLSSSAQCSAYPRRAAIMSRVAVERCAGISPMEAKYTSRSPIAEAAFYKRLGEECSL